MDVAAWLHDLGLGQCEQAFRENDIDADVLTELTADDLIGVGVTSVGHRRKLLAAMAALRSGAAPTLPLVPGTPASISPVASSLPEAERRQVTVLFADLAGYAKFADELDAGEVRELSSEASSTLPLRTGMQACDLLAEAERLGIGPPLGPLRNCTSLLGSKKRNVNVEGIFLAEVRSESRAVISAMMFAD